MSTTENTVRLKHPLEASMLRYIEGWTPLEVRQHRDLFATALRAIDAFVTSPRGQGMHADALRFWNYQRSTFYQHALLLTHHLNP